MDELLAAAQRVLDSVDGAWLFRGEEEVLAEWRERADPASDYWKCLEVDVAAMADLLEAVMAIQRAKAGL